MKQNLNTEIHLNGTFDSQLKIKVHFNSEYVVATPSPTPAAAEQTA